MQANQPTKLVSPQAVAEFFNVSRATVLRLTHQKRIPVTRLTDKTFRYDLDQLREIFRKNV